MPGTIYTTAPNTSAILAYAKLEPRAIDNNLSTTLQVQVHDALWMITQQWRMGEFKGMDGGSAIRAKVNSKTSLINRFKPSKSSNASEYIHDKPLETVVEGINIIPDLLLSVQMGKYFLKLLKIQKDLTNGSLDYRAAFISKFAITLPSSTNDISNSNLDLLGLITSLNNKSLDGYELYKAIKLNTNPNNVLGVAPGTINSIDLGYIQIVFDKYHQWFVKNYNIPEDPMNSSWSENSLDYKFKVSVPETDDLTSTQIVLGSDSYKNGKLDWYDFDLNDNINLTNGGTISNEKLGGNGETIIQSKTHSYIPTSIEFKGMPVSRWWEFEYADLDIGNMLVNKQDMLKMMVANFGQIFSNDWLIVPLKVRAGSFCEIENLLVTDVFGKHSLIKPAGTGQDNNWQRWSMFNLNIKGEEPVPGDIRLFIPPTVINRLESEPLEKVVFLKDEMANMVWAIEEIVSDGVKGGIEGKLAELQLHSYYTNKGTYVANENIVNLNDASIKFKLMNSLPENWIPFIPVKDLGAIDGRSIKYRRATFKRVVNNIDTDENVTPRTSLLKPNGSNAYYINEEEILKPGVIVSTNYQRTRWYNGKVVTWIGRNRINGRGQGKSGLKFDFIENKE